jgi:hypothetical protein
VRSAPGHRGGLGERRALKALVRNGPCLLQFVLREAFRYVDTEFQQSVAGVQHPAVDMVAADGVLLRMAGVTKTARRMA